MESKMDALCAEMRCTNLWLYYEFRLKMSIKKHVGTQLPCIAQFLNECSSSKCLSELLICLFSPSRRTLENKDSYTPRFLDINKCKITILTYIWHAKI